MNLEQYETGQLSEMRGLVRSNVAVLERKGASRTVSETHELADQRSLLRRLTRLIKTRIVQVPLF